MQYSVLAPLLIFAYSKRKTIGWTAQVLLIFACTVYNLVMHYHYDLFPNPIFGGKDYNDWIYFKSQARANPYLIGMCCAFLWHSDLQAQFLPQATSASSRMLGEAIILACLAIIGFLVFIPQDGLYECADFSSNLSMAYCKSPWSLAARMLYGSLGRLFWGVGVGGVSLMLAKGHGSWLNSFLGWTGWQPTGKLTYVGYLVHVGILTTYYCSSNYFIEYSDAWYASTYTAVCIWTMGIALLFWMLVEQPLANLLGLTFGSAR